MVDLERFGYSRILNIVQRAETGIDPCTDLTKFEYSFKQVEAILIRYRQDLLELLVESSRDGKK